jgi:hypothetical protein
MADLLAEADRWRERHGGVRPAAVAEPVGDMRAARR